MYWEAVGLQGSASSAAIEDAARWVQWAQDQMLQGAANHEDNIRYNLDQFWQAKAADYYSEPAEGQNQLDKLDVIAHGLWEALETSKIYSSSPSYWDYWKKFWAGGTPDRPNAQAAAQAATAADQAAQKAAAQAGGQTAAAFVPFFQSAETNVQNDVNQANQLWKEAGVSIGGIPLWVWAVVGIGAVVWLGSKR